MTDLLSKHCRPCEGGAAAMDAAEAERLLAELDGWTIVDGHHLTKTFPFANFVDALAYVNRLGEVAEDEGHHPNISFTWGRVSLEIYTHDAGGLTENDFILAAKADRAL